jgi:hypothetical protein
MKNLVVFLILFTTIILNDILAQQQSIVIIQMHGYPTKADPEHHQGGGVSPLEIFPFIISVIENNNEKKDIVYNQHDRRNPIETLPLLYKEINDWLLKGYKLFSFNAVDGGMHSYKYTVVLVKEV